MGWVGSSILTPVVTYFRILRAHHWDLLRDLDKAELRVITLFLDFDGVLHRARADDDELFCRLALLENVLRDFPQVQIVISSSWAEQFSLDELKCHLGGLASRTIGVIPKSHPVTKVPAHLRDYSRHAACHAWLRRRQALDRPWIALDDDGWRYSPSTPNLIVIDGTRGMTEADACALRERLADIVGSWH